MSNLQVFNFQIIIEDLTDKQMETKLDELFEIGCNDCTLSKINGVTYLDFYRLSISKMDAIESALVDLQGIVKIKELNM